MQAEQVIHKVPRATGTLGGCVDTLDPFQQRVHGFCPAFHSRGIHHEFGQELQDVNVEHSFLVGYQVVDNILRINADGER